VISCCAVCVSGNVTASGGVWKARQIASESVVYDAKQESETYPSPFPSYDIYPSTAPLSALSTSHPYHDLYPLVRSRRLTSPQLEVWYPGFDQQTDCVFVHGARKGVVSVLSPNNDFLFFAVIVRVRVRSSWAW